MKKGTVKPIENTMRVAKAPGVSVDFFVEGDLITKVALNLSSNFESRVIGNQHLNESILGWLESYLSIGNTSLDLPLAPFKLPSFSRQVMAVLPSIPRGQVLTYRQLAEKLGNPNAARAVGRACGSNIYPLIFPCHRVVASNGKIGGFSAGGIEVKKRLLNFEAVGKNYSSS
ncbi:MAG: methylated-DNA--[protein]-cysteine S-methyltransferase [Chlamydiota bacterium]